MLNNNLYTKQLLIIIDIRELPNPDLSQEFCVVKYVETSDSRGNSVKVVAVPSTDKNGYCVDGGWWKIVYIYGNVKIISLVWTFTLTYWNSQ